MEHQKSFTPYKLECLDAGAPELDVDAAWVRLQPRLRKRSWDYRKAAGIAAGVLAAVLLAAPGGRTWAESLWNSFTLGRIQNLEIDAWSTPPVLLLPNVFPFFPASQATYGDASTAGFRVRRLAGAGEPEIEVQTPPPVERMIDRKAIEAALRLSGRVVPSPWPLGLEDGAKITLVPTSNVIMSRYGSCPELVGPWHACSLLVQAKPMELRLPPQVRLDEYTRFSLELAGIPKPKVDHLMSILQGSPVLFLPLETLATLTSIRVRGDDGVLVTYPKAASGETAYVLQWEEDGFNFLLYGRDPGTAVQTAASMQR